MSDRSASGNERRRLFAIVTAVGVVAIVGAILALGWTLLRPDGPTTLGQVWQTADDSDHEDLQAFLRAQVGGIHDTIPNGDIGRILQRNVTKPFGGVSVTSNNAGMRDDRPYGPKPAGTWRVIVLGDSFAFGHEGLEEDRVGEQLEAMLQRHATVPGTDAIEVLTVAQGSWTAVNETAYMISHFSAYDPDLVIVLLVSNDLDDTQGVRGFGATTNTFSPEYRDHGSAFFSVYNPGFFGHQTASLLYGGLGPESNRRWTKAFAGLARLEATVEAAGAKLLVTAFDEFRHADPLYQMSLWSDLIVEHHRQARLESPLLFVDPYLEPDTVVGVHPNRKGHGFLALHYAHALASLGWIQPNEADPLPPPHPRMNMRISHDLDTERIAAARAAWTEAYLRSEIDFTRLDREAAISIYGGALPWQGRIAATRRLVFLLARPGDAGAIEVRVEVPPLPELFPFALDLSVHGRAAGRLELASLDEAGEHTLRASLPDGVPVQGPLEIELYTRAHWAEIGDSTMLSYYPLRARLVE